MKYSSKYAICAAVLAAWSVAGAQAQDLNPTVEVSRQYRGVLADIDKPSVEMAVPDSVMKFNLEFDYSVFDSPFKGAYEFRPYVMNMDLAPGYSGERTFYLKAGAGYSLHPELDAVWSPFKGDSFRLSVYAGHRSYVGSYRTTGLKPLAGDAEITRARGGFQGYDLLSKAGIDGAYDWENGCFSFDAGYYGTALKDTTVRRGYDAFDLKMGISSKKTPESCFTYNVGVRYRYAEDKLKYADDYADAFGLPLRNCLTEHDLDVDASFGGSFRSGHSLMVDLGFDFASYGAVLASNAGNLSVTPRYIFSKGLWKLNLGVKFAFLLRNNSYDTLPQMNTAKGQIVYPDVKISLTAIRNHLDVYLAAGGGPDINSYASLIDDNRHVTPYYNIAGQAPLLDNTVERVSAAVGLKGGIAARFRYDLSAGYRNFANAPLETVTIAGRFPTAGIAYSPWQMFYVNLDYFWNSEDVDIAGNFQYRSTDVRRRGLDMFAPAAFTGYVDLRYNLKKRIYFGIDCNFSTSRHGTVNFTDGSAPLPEVVVPGFADLGVNLEYAFTRKLSFWLRTGNLLDMTIQRVPLYTESGIYFTAGIRLLL